MNKTALIVVLVFSLLACLVLNGCSTGGIPAESVAEKSGEPSTEPSTEPSVEQSEESSKAPAEESSKVPTEESSKAPTEESSKAPVEESSKAPVEESSKAPTEESSKAPTEESSKAPVEESSKAPTEESSKAPTEESSKAPVEESSKAPVEESSKAPTEESSKVPTEESSKAPTEESSKAPSEESSKPPVEESSKAPAEESSQDPGEESSQDPGETLPHGTLSDFPVIENRAVWYRSTEKTVSEVRATVAEMARRNINTLYLETWYNGMFIGDVSDLPLIKHHPNNGDLDALKAFGDACSEYGIELHAWVENFYIGLDSFDLPKATAGHHLLDKFGGNTCSTVYGKFVFLNPYDEFSKQLLKSVYGVILNDYSVSGLHLDYIRFPEAAGINGSDFGYNDDIIAGFRAEYNTDIDPKTMAQSGADWENWCAFRAGIITEWVGEVFEFAQKECPGICLSAAVDPDYPNCKKTRMQDYITWVQNGWMDEIFTMSYTSNTAEILAHVQKYLALADGGCFYTIGISGGNGNDIIQSQIIAARSGGSYGVNIFSYGDIKNKGGSFDSVCNSVWGESSVRADSLNIAVEAFAKRMRHNLLAVYAYEADAESSYISELCSVADNLLSSAQNLSSDASLREKSDYCTSAIAKLENLLTKIHLCTDNGMKNQLKADTEFIISCLEISLNRLTAKSNVN